MHIQLNSHISSMYWKKLIHKKYIPFKTSIFESLNLACGLLWTKLSNTNIRHSYYTIYSTYIPFTAHITDKCTSIGKTLFMLKNVFFFFRFFSSKGRKNLEAVRAKGELNPGPLIPRASTLSTRPRPPPQCTMTDINITLMYCSYINAREIPSYSLK